MAWEVVSLASPLFVSINKYGRIYFSSGISKMFCHDRCQIFLNEHGEVGLKFTSDMDHSLIVHRGTRQSSISFASISSYGYVPGRYECVLEGDIFRILKSGTGS